MPLKSSIGIKTSESAHVELLEQGGPALWQEFMARAVSLTGLRAVHKVGRVERRQSCILPFAGRLTGTP
jgi:hypothetical protein